MKIRAKQIGVSRCEDDRRALVFSLPVILVFMLLAPVLGQLPAGVGAMILFPFMYALVSYLTGLLCAWIYNLVAQRVGGFEYTAAEVSSWIKMQ